VANSEDQSPGTPRPGSPVAEPVETPVIKVNKALPWRSKVR